MSYIPLFINEELRKNAVNIDYYTSPEICLYKSNTLD